MSLISLGVSTTIQSLLRANKNIEQKQLVIQMNQSVDDLLRKEVECTLNFGSTSAAPVALNTLPLSLNTMFRMANPQPVVAFAVYNGQAANLQQNGMLEINEMKLENFTPTLDNLGNFTNAGEADFSIQTSKHSSSDGGDDFRAFVVRLKIRLNSIYDPGNLAGNVIDDCVAVGGVLENAPQGGGNLQDSPLRGTAPIARSDDGSYVVNFPAGHFSSPPVVFITPLWVRFSGDEDTTWWVDNVSVNGFRINWHGPTGTGNWEGEAQGVMWKAEAN